MIISILLCCMTAFSSQDFHVTFNAFLPSRNSLHCSCLLKRITAIEYRVDRRITFDNLAASFIERFVLEHAFFLLIRGCVAGAQRLIHILITVARIIPKRVFNFCDFLPICLIFINIKTLELHTVLNFIKSVILGVV